MQEIQDSSLNLSELSNRLRLLERKNYSLNEKLLIINNNLINEHRKVLQEIKGMSTDLREVKSELFNMQNTLRQIIKEMNSFAKKENLMVLEKYINLWNPLNFVTEEEVLKLIKENKREVKNGDKGKKRSSR